MAVQHFNKLNIKLNVKVWAARPGVRNLVLEKFKTALFIDDSFGWHGKIKYEPQSKINHHIKSLTSLELKHFSYTYSRTKYFRNPAKSIIKDTLLFNEILKKTFILLAENKIEICYFVDFPHSLSDLGFYYSARRLNLPVVTNDGPYIGDYFWPVIVSGSQRYIKKYKHGKSIFSSIARELRKRNLKYTIRLPSYMSNPNKKIPKVPPANSFFFRKAVFIAYGITKSEKACRFLEILLHNLKKVFQFFYLKAVWLIFASKNELKKSKKFCIVFLQYHPEKTTSCIALDTPFEEERISKLAQKHKSLQILVQEHPMNLKNTDFNQYRSFSALKKMTRHKNVSYIFPGNRKSMKSLIEQAVCVISTAGTVALESIQLGTPAIHFSKSFAQGFPGVLNLSSVQNINLKILKKIKSELISMSPVQLSRKILCALKDRPMHAGFITGYCNKEYQEEQLIKSAKIIIINGLQTALECSQKQ